MISEKIVVQGDWHVQYVRTILRRPGLIVLGVGTDEKRPGLAYATFEGHTHTFIVSGRYGYTYPDSNFEKGDGSEATILDIKLPATLPGRTWVVSADDWDKYESRIVAYTVWSNK